MSYPGFVAVLLGVSLATLLYYMFGQNEHEQEPHGEYYEDHPENYRGRSRSRSSAGNTDECSICLSHVTALNRVQLRPCKHVFHFRCIKTWSSEGQQVNLVKFKLAPRTSDPLALPCLLYAGLRRSWTGPTTERNDVFRIAG